MPLFNDEETLKIEIENLEEKNKELDKNIFVFDKEIDNLIEQIQSIEYKINNLREQKKQDDWQLTFLNVISIGLFKFFRNKNINSQIKSLKTKVRTLKIKIKENEENKQPLKDLKISILERIKNSWKTLFLKNEKQRMKKISEKLDLILENQKNKKVPTRSIDYPPSKNSFEEEFSSTVLTNSSVSDLPFDNNNNYYPNPLNPFSETDEENKIAIINEFEEKKCDLRNQL
ncbi:hypothetical protein [Spiroplasma endosymbiont of Virgichneumon dumeticola]|uniref:hypothetical protein n=1 Tax=Spiroplasma endosymbiont of Virgichneumon dumeticola TaxID=3139323 RepID=UPI0035C89C14